MLLFSRFRYYALGSLQCNDGCVVYCNGIEVFRRNLPASPAAITYTTLATISMDTAPVTAITNFTVPSTAIVNGVNTLAVEVCYPHEGVLLLTQSFD